MNRRRNVKDGMLVNAGLGMEMVENLREENKVDLKKAISSFMNGYVEANKNDYCSKGEYQGMRPDEIVNKFIFKMKKIGIK